MSASGRASSCCLDLACEPGSGDQHCWPPGPSLSGAGWGVPRCLLAPPLPPVLPRTPPTSAIPEPCPLCSDTSCCHVPTLPWPAWHLSPCPGGTGPPPSPSSRARLPLPELRHAPGTDSSPLPLAAPCVVVGLVTIQWESMTLENVSCEVRSLRRTPQKDVGTCSPRWLHSPAGEERAKAWASDKGQSSTLVAEGPQGFCPRPPFSAGPQGPGELPSPLSDAAVTIYPSLKGQSRAAASSRPPASARGTVLGPSSPPGGTSIPRLATPDPSCWCFPRDLEAEAACALPSGSVCRRGLVRWGLCLLSQAPTSLCRDRGVGASSQSGPGRPPLASAPRQQECPPLPQSPRFRSKQRVDRGCWNPRGRT